MSDLKKSSTWTSKILFQASKKCFFQISTRFLFWLVEQFLPSFHECYAYVWCSFQSKQNFRLNQSITRHEEMITQQEKKIFVGFKKIIRWHRQEPISVVIEIFCQTLTSLLFYLIEFFSMHFCARYTYVKCLLESRETFGIN